MLENHVMKIMNQWATAFCIAGRRCCTKALSSSWCSGATPSCPLSALSVLSWSLEHVSTLRLEMKEAVPRFRDDWANALATESPTQLNKSRLTCGSARGRKKRLKTCREEEKAELHTQHLEKTHAAKNILRVTPSKLLVSSKYPKMSCYSLASQWSEQCCFYLSPCILFFKCPSQPDAAWWCGRIALSSHRYVF